MITQLITEQNVRGVVCLNQPHEVEHGWVASKSDWEDRDVRFYWLPTPDFFSAPSHVDVGHAVEFIRGFEKSGQSVYVHCKAGRTRSATVVMCYLMARNGWSPEKAEVFMRERRRQVILRHAHRQTIEAFYKDLKSKAVSTI
jgi:atypical dual specificity phosphatase